MPSNKQRDLLKKQAQEKQAETTGKNQTIFHTCGLFPEKEGDTVVYKIIEIGFTVSGNHASIVSSQVIDSVKNEAAAFVKLNAALVKCGAMDIKHLRKLAQKAKE